MYSSLVNGKSQDEKAKGVNRNVVATISQNKFCWIKNVWDIWWIRLKVISEWEMMKSTKLHCLFLMMKYLYLNNCLKKLFCQAYSLNFQSNQNNFFVKHIKFQKHKTFRKELNEE